MSSTLVLAKPAKRHLVWLPAVLLIAFGALSAAGITMVPDSTASTATATVAVNASVAAEVHIVLSNCLTPNVAPPAGVAAGNAVFANVSLTTSDGATNLGQCDLGFGSNNNAAGTQLTVLDSRPAGGSNNFLCASAIGVACAGNDFTDDPGGDATLADGQAGVTFPTLTCSGATPMNNTDYYPVGASAPICTDVLGGGDSTLTLSVRANPSGTQPAGAYTGQANFIATTL